MLDSQPPMSARCPLVNASSNWSMHSTASSPAFARAAARLATGSRPGVSTTTSYPWARSAGTMPAFISDDLPQPEGPTRASNGLASSRRRHASTSSRRPKKVSRCSSSYGTRPIQGQWDDAARASWSAASEESWARMACSSSTSPEPGSRPSSWPSARRAVRIDARASRCRPQRYCARASSSQRRSRHGCSPASTTAPETTSWCRPASSRACSRSSSASRRSSSRRVASNRPGIQSRSSVIGSPRHSASARSSEDAARSGDPEWRCSRPCSSSCSNSSRSSSSRPGISR